MKAFENDTIENTITKLGKCFDEQSAKERIEASKNMGIHFSKVKCPHCGYEMPILRTEFSECKGLFVKCKGKNCKKTFEIKITK